MAKEKTVKAKTKTKSKASKKPGKSVTNKAIKPGDQSIGGALFCLFVTAIDKSGQLVGKRQTKPNGAFQANWTAITSGTYELQSSSTTNDGRVAIVATDASTKSVHYIAETTDGSSSKGGWLAPVNLGLPKGQKSFQQVLLVRGANGLDNVFGITPNNDKKSIWWKYRNPSTVVMKKEKVTPPGATKSMTITVPVVVPPKQVWSDWVCINGILEGNLSNLQAANNLDGNIVLMGCYFNGIMWCAQQVGGEDGTPRTWAKWTSPGNTSDASNDVSPILTSDGFVSAIASTNDGILRSTQSEPGSINWSNFSCPGQINDNVAGHGHCLDGNNNLYLVALNYAGKGTKNWIYGNLQTNTSERVWTGWDRISLVYSADKIELNYQSDDALVMFAFDSATGTLRSKKQVVAGGTEWYQNWDELGVGLKNFSLTRDLTI